MTLPVGLRLVHLHNVEWYNAPIPPRIHQCWAQTTGFDILGLRVAERCACGGVRLDGDNPYRLHDGWFERNSRRKDEPTPKPKKWWQKK